MSRELDIVAKTINDIRLMIMNKDNLKCEEIKAIDITLLELLEFLHNSGLVGGEE